MQLAANWRTVVQTVAVAVFAPGRLNRVATAEKPRGGVKRPATALRAFLLAFGFPVVEDSVARQVRAAQISAVARLTPFTILANVINLVAITAIGPQFYPAEYVFAWVAGLSFFIGMMTYKWLKTKNVRIESVSRNAVNRVLWHATVLSCFWSIIPIAAFAHGSPQAIWYGSCITAGMICSGGFTLATVPQAALRWVSITYMGALLSLFIGDISGVWSMAVLLTSYVILVSACVASAAWFYTSHFLAVSELKNRGEIIALLMNDVEEKNSDWFWETDSVGVLKNLSPRFATASGRTYNQLRAMRMVDLAYSLDTPDGREAMKELQNALFDEVAFRDVVIGVDVKGQEAWWSLTGRPAYDEHGYFSGYQGVASDITETRKASAMVEHLAEHDSLTGIGNRSWFLKKAEELLEDQQTAQKKTLTLFLIDLDNFKVVNDTGGHPAGDELLQQVAARFTALSEGKTMLARFGGDEFAALGQFVSDQAASAFAEELVSAARKPFTIGRRDFAIGATIGFTRYSGKGESVDDLMRNADIALYKAKEGGRGRALPFASEMEREVRERRELESDLREAFEHGKLSIEFQPIVGARSGEVVSSEVLVRWLHPERGEVPPGTFIPIAEHAGLILPLGHWVLKRACAVAAQCPDLQSVAVNLSPVQFMDPNLVETVRDVLMETGFPGDRLVLEITESVFLKDHGSAAKKLEQLRDMGIRVALDDFGTGYSSLSYLRLYKFDKIKIDKSFVDEIGERSDGLAIISAVIALAHNLGLEVTAEGVERQFQVDALRTLGCDTMQGYYFGAPDSNPMKITHIKKEDWEERAPSTAPENPGMRSVS